MNGMTKRPSKQMGKVHDMKVELDKEQQVYVDKQVEALRTEISNANAVLVKIGIFSATAIGVIWSWTFSADLQCTAAIYSPVLILGTYLIIFVIVQLVIDKIGKYMAYLEGKIGLSENIYGWESWRRSQGNDILRLAIPIALIGITIFLVCLFFFPRSLDCTVIEFGKFK